MMRNIGGITSPDGRFDGHSPVGCADALQPAFRSGFRARLMPEA
jgi:hypothetical protein